HTAVSSALKMLHDGADIIDVGGESTRPGSDELDLTEEVRRAVPVIEGIAARQPAAVISVDTRRRHVAERAIRAGATIINDISGFRDDPSMVDLARESGCGLIVMHMLGRPKTMQQDIRYRSFPGDLVEFFEERTRYLEDAGIDPGKIVIDPGIGFGKTFDQNLILINRLDRLTSLGKPVLVGASRKSFIGKILDEPEASARDTGTMATVAACIMRGASIVRVHDVRSAVQICRVTDAIVRERVEP
ncbi:MAG: dihydropteroate synthase, partial [Desulfomonilaceae bacterium]|nr:dihydropteroate synthase [Desulfomonilaceae bacterium]